MHVEFYNKKLYGVLWTLNLLILRFVIIHFFSIQQNDLYRFDSQLFAFESIIFHSIIVYFKKFTKKYCGYTEGYTRVTTKIIINYSNHYQCKNKKYQICL